MKSPLPAMLPRFAVSSGDLDSLSYRDSQRYVADREDAGFGMLWLPEVLGREAFTSAQLSPGRHDGHGDRQRRRPVVRTGAEVRRGRPGSPPTPAPRWRTLAPAASRR